MITPFFSGESENPKVQVENEIITISRWGEIFGSRKLFPSRFAFLLNIFSCPSDGKIRHDEKVKAHKLGDRILKVKLLVCTQTNRQGERQKRVLLTLSLPHSRHCALISFFMLLLRPACFCCCLRTFPSYNPFLIGRLRDEEKKRESCSDALCCGDIGGKRAVQKSLGFRGWRR